MEVSVIIEPVTGNGYRVTGAGGLSVGLTAEGATVSEAIDRLTDQVRLARERWSQVGRVEHRRQPGPLEAGCGILRDDPLYELWREAMEEHRHQLEEDPSPIPGRASDWPLCTFRYGTRATRKPRS